MNGIAYWQEPFSEIVIVGSWQLPISMVVLLCKQSDCYLFFWGKNSPFNSTNFCIRLAVTIAYFSVANLAWGQIFSFYGEWNLREIFKFSCGRCVSIMIIRLVDGKITWSGGVWSRAGVFWKCFLVFVSNSQSWRWFLVFGLIRSVPLSMGWLKVWATCAFIFPAEFTTSWLIWTAGSSFGGGTLSAPFLSRILRFFLFLCNKLQGLFSLWLSFWMWFESTQGVLYNFYITGVHGLFCVAKHGWLAKWKIVALVIC